MAMKDEETVALIAGGNCEVVCLIIDCERPRLAILAAVDCSAECRLYEETNAAMPAKMRPMMSATAEVSSLLGCLHFLRSGRRLL
jgi:hypothetical protein